MLLVLWAFRKRNRLGSTEASSLHFTGIITQVMASRRSASPEGDMDKLPLRQTVIASTFFAAARTDAFTSPARFDFDFYSLSFGLG
jgi:hypothetical protein